MMLIPPTARENYKNVTIQKGLFSVDECAKIRELAPNYRMQEATTTDGNEEKYGSKHRRARVRWITQDDHSAFMYERLAAAVSKANALHFGFALTGFLHGLQYTEYEEGGKFDWHMDFGSGRMSCRKVSVTILLNSPQDFAGGQFEVLCYGGKNTLTVDTGDAVIFPSYVVHRVAPISRGLRLSLVAWVYGPPYV